MKDLKSLSLEVRDNKLFLLDQTKLPYEEIWFQVYNLSDFATAVKELKIRGAPLIGLASAIFVALQKQNSPLVFKTLKELRPTAFNVIHAMNQLSEIPKEKIVETVESWFEQDCKICNQIAYHGKSLVSQGDCVLTYCNTGGLTCAGQGTALGIIKIASSYIHHVYVPETRPLLQGARLTTWELQKHKMDYTLICDHTVASLMASRKIQKIFVGADRIAKNGDFANKIGTYNLAVLAHHHKIPFYIAAPLTTYDSLCATGEDIPIEIRPSYEVTLNRMLSVYNPAFDITPHPLITGWITEKGIWDHKSWLKL